MENLMQPTQNTEIFDTSLALISTNMEAWSNLLAEDAIMEIPYATAIGRQYQQDYVTRMEIKDGKMVHLCDYSNPVAVMYAFGST
jgi:ketosteroid isomerase-like protein